MGRRRYQCDNRLHRREPGYHPGHLGHSDPAAIATAAAAVATWHRRMSAEHADLLMAWDELMVAVIMTLEQGKPLAGSRGEITNCASFARWPTTAAYRIDSQIVATPGAGRRACHEGPAGVAAVIMPWNCLNTMITCQVAPIRVAGCTVAIEQSKVMPF